MNANELLALADKVEKATGPDRAIDHMIAVHLGEGMLGELLFQRMSYEDWQKQLGDNPHSWVSPYTASLDAAVTLIPKGRFWLGGLRELREVSQYGGDHLSKGGYVATLAPVSGPGGVESHAATLALALTAAALRALASVGTLPKGQDGEAGLVRSKGDATRSEAEGDAQTPPGTPS